MAEIVIEKNIPLPEHTFANGNPKQQAKYLFLSTLEVGDSFLYPCEGVDPNRAVNRMRPSAKRLGIKLSYRTLLDQPGTIRIWRAA